MDKKDKCELCGLPTTPELLEKTPVGVLCPDCNLLWEDYTL